MPEAISELSHGPIITPVDYSPTRPCRQVTLGRMEVTFCCRIQLLKVTYIIMDTDFLIFGIFYGVSEFPICLIQKQWKILLCTEILHFYYRI
mgnify:CR=1 FL=1